ncbi:MAG: hypothetical protein IKC87_05365 [Clostridia bacterium]|nr:hypothetical protein [Clostridia bacterium]
MENNKNGKRSFPPLATKKEGARSKCPLLLKFSIYGYAKMHQPQREDREEWLRGF